METSGSESESIEAASGDTAADAAGKDGSGGDTARDIVDTDNATIFNEQNRNRMKKKKR